MILAYLAERFRPAVFVPLAATIAAAAGGGRFALVPFAADLLAALLLLLQFRVWDDLADRSADRLRHPRRVLVTASSVVPFDALFLVAAIGNVAWCSVRSDEPIAILTLLGLHAGLGLWYLLRTKRTIAGDQLLVAKYPAFVIVIAGARVFETPLITATGAAAIYVAASLYEAWHDPVSPLNASIGGRS